jgi:hypothetical protein
MEDERYECMEGGFLLIWIEDEFHGRAQEMMILRVEYEFLFSSTFLGWS